MPGSDIIPFIIYKVMKYRKIFIKYNAYFKKAVFHSRENIKKLYFHSRGKYKLYFSGKIWMSSAFSIDFFEHTSEFLTPVTFL